MKEILIIGGTNFIGRNLVNQIAKDKRYNLTLFNRGITNPCLFSSVNSFSGDRNTDDIKKIEKNNWHCIIDLSCYFPKSLKKILEHLRGDFRRYIFISSCAAYGFSKPETDEILLRDESAATLSCSKEKQTNPSLDTYGNRKAECERILVGENIDYLIFRPALVFGKYDETDRLYYWIYQIKKNHTIILPDNGERFLSYIYVNDLVNIIYKGIEMENHNRVYNAVSYPQISIKNFIETATNIMQLYPKMINGSLELLIKNNIKQWFDMPLWLNGDYFTFSNKRLVNDFKIEITDFKKSLVETIAYYDSRDWRIPKFGISEERKKGLIDVIKKD